MPMDLEPTMSTTLDHYRGLLAEAHRTDLPAYRCTECRHTSDTVNWSDATHLDWEGNVHHVAVPTCTHCGGRCRQLPTLTAALVDIARGAAT